MAPPRRQDVLLLATRPPSPAVCVGRSGGRPSSVLLGIGCAMLVGTLAWVATFPANISI
jgi:hypothetical protein